MLIRILIVDDDADLRSVLAAVLRPFFSILEASNGPAALEVVKREHPRLALVDMSMPGMDGLEVLAAAKTLDPGLIVVMLTSERDLEVAARALKLGATEYVTKPFDAEYIRAEVIRLTGASGESLDGKPWKVV